MAPVTTGSLGAATRPLRSRARTSPSCASSRRTIPKSAPTATRWPMRSVRVASTSRNSGGPTRPCHRAGRRPRSWKRSRTPTPWALATAAFYRGRVAGLLAGDSAVREFSSWPESARREADLAVADLRASVARGFRRADIVRRDEFFKSLATRDDVKSLLAEMERPAAKTAKAEAPASAPRVPSPLDHPGRLEEDRFLGELTIGLLAVDDRKTNQGQSHLEAMLARVEARRKSGPGSPALAGVGTLAAAEDRRAALEGRQAGRGEGPLGRGPRAAPPPEGR